MAREDTGEIVEKTRVESAIYRLKDKGQDINPYSVAEEAGLERALVSRDKNAMELIVKARGGDLTFELPNNDILRRCNELDATILEMENENNLLAMKVSELEDKLLQSGTGGSDDINEQVKALLSSESDVQIQQMERELEAAYAQVVQLQEDNKDIGHSVSGLEKVNEALNARLRELEDECKSLKDAASSGDDSSSGKDDGTGYSGTDPDELVSANREMKRRIKDLAEGNRKQLRRIKDLEQSNEEKTRLVEAAEQQKAELQQEAESLGAQLSNTWNVAYQKGFADAEEKAKQLIAESQAKMQNDLQSLQYVQVKSEAQFQADIQTARADAKARAAEVEMLQSEITALRQALSQTQQDLANMMAQQQQAAAAHTEQSAPSRAQSIDEQMMTGELVAYGSPGYPAQTIGSEPARAFTFAPAADVHGQVAVAEVAQEPAQAAEPAALHEQFQEDQELQDQLQKQHLQVQMQEQQIQAQMQEQQMQAQHVQAQQEPAQQSHEALEPINQQETLPPPSHYEEPMNQGPLTEPAQYQPQSENFGNRLYDQVAAESGQEILNFARTGPYLGSQANPLESMSWRDLETVYSMGVLSIKDFAQNIPDPYKKTTGDFPMDSAVLPQQDIAQQPSYEQPPVYGEQESLYQQPPPYYADSLYEGQLPGYGEQYQQSPGANPYANHGAPDNGGQGYDGQAYGGQPHDGTQAYGVQPGYDATQNYGGLEYTGQDYGDNQGLGSLVGSESLTNTSESAVMDPAAFDDSDVLDLDQLDIFEDLEELEDLNNIEIMADDPLVNELLEPGKRDVSPDALQNLVVKKVQQTKDMNEQAAAARAAAAAAGGNGEEKAAKLHKFVGQKAQAAAAQAAQDAPPPPPPNPHAASNFVRAKPVPPEIKKHLGILGLTMDTLTKEAVLKEWKVQAAANHPDKGGSPEIATAINQAKLELLKYLEKNEPKLGKKFGRKPTE
jgi:hypothetical protein